MTSAIDDVVAPFATVANTFGRVNAIFTTHLVDGLSKHGNNENESAGEIWLAGESPKIEANWNAVSDTGAENVRTTAAVALNLSPSLSQALLDYEAKNTMSNSTSSLADASAVVRVRCGVSFPDVVQQARALQLLSDAVATETDAVIDRLIAAETAVAALQGRNQELLVKLAKANACVDAA